MLNYFDDIKYFNSFSLLIFLVLAESNSWNFPSEIITNNLEKLMMKIYRFQWNFSLQILSHCLCILNQTLLQLLYDFPKGSPVPFNLLCTNVYTHSLSLWILSLLHFSAYSLNFGQPFTPKHWILFFLSKVLLQMRHLSSSSILDKFKKEEDSITNGAIKLVIFILYR